MGIAHRLATSAARHPDAIALEHDGRRVSYGQLWRESMALCGFLQREGVRVGERVALLLENSAAYVASCYGAMAAGGVSVALNVQSRAPELKRLLHHCAARWVIADARNPQAVRTRAEMLGGARWIWVNEEHLMGGDHRWQEVVEHPAGILKEGSHQRPAAIIYTSGTTGAPKGVTLSHRNLEANSDSIIAYLGLEASDSILNVLPFYYAYGASVLHTHLAVGGRIVLENSLAYPAKTLARIAGERVTGFAGVPATFALLMGRANFDQYDLTTLRYVTQAGGPMPYAEIARFRRELPHVRFFVMYGQTEATARLAYLPPEALERKPGSVGLPIPGVELEVRDEYGTRVPNGVTGELWARGDNVMLGYWHAPHQSAEVLQAGWLRTGDLARQDDDGYIFLVGRRTEMIKSGAHRISPAEVEEVIAGLHGVAEVAVAGVPDAMLGQVIRAAIVPAEGCLLEPRAIQRHCLDHLPPYKVPKEIVFVPELPRTASGKVRRYLIASNSMESGDRDVFAITES